MRIGFRHLSAKTVDWGASAAEGSTPWRGDCASARTGATRRASCVLPRAGLPDLAASLDIVLPAPRPDAFGTLERDYPDKLLACSLEDLGEVTLEPVGEDKRPFDDGDLASRGVRTRVSYWITSSRHGRLGGLVFGAASWHQKARDDFWSQGARVLGEIVNNDRFLILPSCEGVGLPCPAGVWLRTEKYGVRPVHVCGSRAQRRELPGGGLGAL